MKIEVSHSIEPGCQLAARQLAASLNELDPGLVIYFASSNYNPHDISAAMASAFGAARTVGCSTSGEIVSGKMLKNSVVAMAFSKDALPLIDVAVVKNLSGDVRANVRSAFRQFGDRFGAPMQELSFDDYLGLVMVDGLSRAEEVLMDAVGDMTNVQFVGGSAGDDLKFEKTFVFADGKAYSDAAVLTLLKPACKYEILKTQSFEESGETLKVTKADGGARRVMEFDGEPAAKTYAAKLGTTVAKAADNFMHNPVGLMIADEPYVRSPQQLQGTDMIFYCDVKEGMELSLLKSRDIVADTKHDLGVAANNGQPIRAILNFHCILRTLELQNAGAENAYGELFTEIPTVGFSTYGEQYVGHINQTSTMVLFR